MAGGKAGKDSGKVKQKAVSRSARAGLQFPVGRCVVAICRIRGRLVGKRTPQLEGGGRSLFMAFWFFPAKLLKGLYILDYKIYRLVPNYCI